MFHVTSVSGFVTHVATRIPFRYGIAEMTTAPHVLVQATVEHDGRSATGWASEHLPPKWFTKDPQSHFIDDIREMVSVIEHAIHIAEGISADSPFDLWWQLHQEQQQWGRSSGIPGLLSSLGTALVERALIDATCRGLGVPFERALRCGTLGFDAARLHPELEGQSFEDWFPPAAAPTIAVRHTVGLSDPLTDEEVVGAPPDSLPVSLESVIRFYAVSHFKVKTSGDLASDIERLERIIALSRRLGVDAWFTIDGNESMVTAGSLVAWASGLLSSPSVGSVLEKRLIAVEQPLHRSIALSEEVAEALKMLDVPVIIDESDDDLDSVRLAMDLGYAGGTYKGCKGVFRGLANAALIANRRRFGPAVITAEDLSTLPPLTVNQDLVVAAVMGLTHIERNGHHYFGCVAPLDRNIEDRLLEAHPDAFRRDDEGRVRLRIDGGVIALSSLLASPFGFDPKIVPSTLSPLSAVAATRTMGA